MRRGYDARARAGLRMLSALICLVLLGAAVPGATAQTDGIEAARDEREAVRLAQAEKAAELDPLLARDSELEQAVADLDGLRSLQQAKLEATRLAIDMAAGELADANRRIADKQVEIGALREVARLQAVEAYLKPNGAIVEQVLKSADLTSAARRRALLRSVSTSQADVFDQLRAAEDDLIFAKGEAADALADVEQRRVEEEQQLAELARTQAELTKLREALAVRISEFQAEIDALNEEEAVITATLTSLIAEEDARLRAEEEARRRAELERLLAEQTTAPTPDSPGPAPTPVVPPPTQPPPASASGLIWPTGGVVTSPFGPRWGRLHRGIDINAPTGTPVVAAKGGTVVFAGENGGFGLNAIIDHGGGFATVYAHLSSLSVVNGQSIGQGAGVGLSGCSGSCTGAHLHFETRVNGEAQDPMLYLP